MKTLIVTASSKSKRLGDEAPFSNSSNSFLGKMDEPFSIELVKGRKSIRDEMNIPIGPDIGYSNKSDNALYLPAFQRYAGRTYSKITSEAWNVLENNPDQYDCVILSALYGILRYNEPTRDYAIKQVDKLPSGKKIGTYWRDAGMSEWLYSYIKKNRFDRVLFVLSSSYSDIVQRDKLITRLTDEGIVAEDRQFKEAGGMRSMLVR
ncbi:MAG: peroxide stress protein YaaA, partial [Candidatus Kariarchaeaceae archaeon]